MNYCIGDKTGIMRLCHGTIAHVDLGTLHLIALTSGGEQRLWLT